ncbi:RpiR family transcriptional regulator [Trichococcus patagoniensis]|uniref:RpiR family transcriptional regulator n=1 Tax=Trichococcus patagoniensis TaxID=382641 RepID=A0A2T5IEI9_9LACT|nr:SIS domain-containing protein [Trichococcus patagoniensis]PTQ82234.1 RpiR family transcriptional regulator [Trichococcus patagoniensis]
MKYRVIHQLKERNFERQVSKSEAAVLDYLEINFKSIPNYTAVKVSEESFTSQATLNRACKLLGFKGFSELKYAIIDDLSNMNSSVERHSSKTEYILGKIDFDSGVKLAEELYQGRRKVMLFGLGSSHISALYLQRQLLYLGIPAMLVEEMQMLRKFQDYTLIILSSSGETQRCIQVAKDAVRIGMKVVSITKKDSSLMKTSSVCFLHDVPVDKMQGISREQQLHMILMVNEVIDHLKEKYKDE